MLSSDIEIWFDKWSDPEKPLWVTEDISGNNTFHKSRETALKNAKRLARKKKGKVFERHQFGTLSVVWE